MVNGQGVWPPTTARSSCNLSHFAASNEHIIHGLCLGLVLGLCQHRGQQLLVLLLLLLLLVLLLGLCPYPCLCHGLHQQPLVLVLVLQLVLLLVLLLLLQHPHQQPLQPITVLSSKSTIDETILVCRSLLVFAETAPMPFLLAMLTALTQKSNPRCPWSPPEQIPTVCQARPHEWMHVE
jgi:hypothetical protein